MCMNVAFVFVCSVMLTRFIFHPLLKVEKHMMLVEKGQFDEMEVDRQKNEINNLKRVFNHMARSIKSLIQKVKEEEQIIAKVELDLLQAQINPHFLYNTLNAITWQAADQGAEEISILSNSLGKFFRIGLSKGAEVITLREELEHVSSYLDIQSIRYHSRLSYEIHVDDRCLDFRMIKLILQPLAENSIYHGIKEKQGAGIIKISVSEEESGEGKITELTVWDNGAGIPEEKLAFINETLKRGGTDCEAGYGIYNVNERIRLFYGKDYGLYYESSFGHWTKAVLRIPAMSEEVE